MKRNLIKKTISLMLALALLIPLASASFAVEAAAGGSSSGEILPGDTIEIQKAAELFGGGYGGWTLEKIAGGAISGLVGIGLNKAYTKIFGEKESEVMRALAAISNKMDDINNRIGELQALIKEKDLNDFLNDYRKDIAQYKALYSELLKVKEQLGDNPEYSSTFLIDVYDGDRSAKNFMLDGNTLVGLTRKLKATIVDTKRRINGQMCNIFGAFDLSDKYIHKWEHQGYADRKLFRSEAVAIFTNIAVYAKLACGEKAKDCRSKGDKYGEDMANRSLDIIEDYINEVKEMVDKCVIIEHPDLRIFRLEGTDRYAFYPYVQMAYIGYLNEEDCRRQKFRSANYFTTMIPWPANGRGDTDYTGMIKSYVTSEQAAAELRVIRETYGKNNGYSKTLYDILFDPKEGNFNNLWGLPRGTKFTGSYYKLIEYYDAPFMRTPNNYFRWEAEVLPDPENKLPDLDKNYRILRVKNKSVVDHWLDEKFFSVVLYKGNINQGPLSGPMPEPHAHDGLISGMDSSYVLPANRAITLSVEPKAGATYQWFVDKGDSDKGFEAIEGATSENYIINSLDPSMNGYMYRCAIIDENVSEWGDGCILTDPVTLNLSGEGIPEPVTVHDVSGEEELREVLNKVAEGSWDGHTVRLTADITYPGTIILLNYSLTVDLNGHTLTIQPGSDSEPNINPMSNRAETAAIYALRGNLHVSGGGAVNVVSGQGIDYGVYANAGEVAVNSIISTDGGTAAYVTDGGTITADSISASGEDARAAENFGGTVTVDGSVEAEGKSACGVYMQSYNGVQATVMAGGGICVSGENSQGASVTGEGTWLTVSGGVEVSGTGAAGVTAGGGESGGGPENTCTVYITGNIASPTDAVNAYDNAFVRVAGNVTATEIGATAVTATGAAAEITGDIVSGGTGIRAEAWDLTEPAIGAEVTVLGSVTAPTPLRIEGLPVEESEHTGGLDEHGLYTFTDGASIVRVKPGALISNAVNAETPVITAQPRDVSVTERKKVTLRVEAGVSDGGVLSYQWYKNTSNAPRGGTLIQGATGASYTPPTDKAGTMYYYVVVTNTNHLATGEITAQAVSNPTTVKVKSDGGGTKMVTHTVSFDTNGGSSVPSQYLTAGGRVARPSDPTKDGFVFGGWFTDSSLTKEYDFNTEVTGAFTLYAAWKKSDAAIDIMWNNPFSDVDKSDWFYDAVEYVNKNNIFSGTSKNSFSPELSMTRGMLVTVLHRLAGSPKAGPGTKFSDVPPDAYYYAGVTWAEENGIINGVDEGIFAPDIEVTREQAAAVLWRYAKYCGADVSVGEETNILSYNDAFEISEYAISAIQWACGTGLIAGRPGGYLDPGSGITRAEAAAMLHRLSNEQGFSHK